MRQPNDDSNDYDIVIIESCENCETHQNFARHSEWKYFEQFNQLKRKIEKFVINTVVIKNPVPDELIKTPEIKNQKNLYLNKETNERIVFPRIGSFEIYMYNILISSKLLTNQWPNHYKILQVLAKMIEDKKNGLSLDQYSVYYQPMDTIINPIIQKQTVSKQLESPDKRKLRIVSKKKKGVNPLANRAYRSIERKNQFKDAKSTLEPLSTKLIDLEDPVKSKKLNRYLESKADNRIKLPSLNNTINYEQKLSKQSDELLKLNNQEIKTFPKPEEKKIFNSIKQQEKEQVSIIERKISDITENKLSLLDLRQQYNNRQSQSLFINQQQNEQLKFFENRSVQYSQIYDANKEYMNRSIQYEEDEGFYCDFGIQIDKEIVPKQVTYQYVQTDKVQLVEQPKPYMLDQNLQVQIMIKKEENVQETQTIIKQYIDDNIGTDIISVVNRGLQFPEETVRVLNQNQIIDVAFRHLFEKRRNIVNNQFYSVDRFEEKATKYKWIGRANLNENLEDLKKKVFLECLVFSVYNYFGIKTPERRLSYQSCANIVGQKMKQSALHIMTSQNPELQYLFNFEQCSIETQKYPLSEQLTFKTSKQVIKFNNYGGFLAIAYLLNDYQLFTPEYNHVGLVVVNESVKEIHKLSSLNYQIHPNYKNTDDQIIVNFNKENNIKLNRLSEKVQLQFFSMLTRITDHRTFEELLKYVQQIFIHNSSTYHQFKATITSLHLDKPQTQTVEDFIKMIENRVEKVRQNFKGKLYTYKKYHTLIPTIKYAVPFEHKIQRKLLYKEKIVNTNDLVKHIRNKDNIVIIQGQDGLGKSTLLSEMAQQLRENEKLNVIQFTNLRKEQNRIKQQLFQISKNIIFVDNVDLFEQQAIDIIDRLKKFRFQISYCFATTKHKQAEIFKNRFISMSVIQTKLLPLDNQDIRNFLMKVVKSQSFTIKKDLVDLLLLKQKYTKLLQVPFYLNLYAVYLSSIDCEKYTVREKDITKYMILKEHFNRCTTTHSQEVREMDIKFKEVLPNLRRVAFQYFHNNREINQTIRDILTLYEQNDLIRSQLGYYPVSLESVIPTSNQPLFCHSIFLNYFLNQAYSYFVEKGYRNMKMEKLYNNKFQMDLMIERYKSEQTHSQLIQVVFNSKKFKNTTEASSNAITLLCKMGFVFSNINFDQCNICDGDLSNSTFYQCSFRGANLEQTILYKSQMINCVFDNAQMSKISLFSKKYQIQFTAMTASLSVDGKRIAFGCGNYLIIISSQTGSEIKRIEAHLDVIRIVRYTKDGNSLISVADDKTLRIWDLYTWKSVVFKLPQKGSINYSNQTETIASVSKNNLKVWNLKSMANEAELQGHTDIITVVQFSYDGNLVLTGSKDTTLRLWDIKGVQKNCYKGHNSQIVVGKLSPLKRTMLSSSKDKDIIMWQVQTGNKILTKKFMNEICQICLDNKQQYITVVFNNDNHIVILDFVTFDIMHALGGHQAKIISLSFDHNFQQLISLSKDRTARVWQFNKIMQSEISRVKLAKKIHRGQVLAIAYDKIKRKYATSHENGEINIWNAEDNELIDQIFSHNGSVMCLSYDKTSKLYSGGSDGSLRIWNLEAKRQPRNIEVHSSEMIQLKLSQKNRIIATCSVANELVLYDFTGIKIIMSTRQEGRLNAIEFSDDEKLMAVGGAEKYVVLYSIANSNTVTRQQQLGIHSDAVTSLCFYKQNLLVVALKNGHVAIWNHIKSNLIKKIQNVSSIRNIINFQKKYICFSSEDGKIRIINMDQGKQIRVFRYSEFPTAIDTNEDDSLLYVGTNTGNIIKWNLNCVKPPVKKIEFDRKAIDIDCTKIVTVESGQTLLIKDLYYHKQQVADVKLDSDIEGVTFDEDRIIMLLKNGKYWEYGKKEYKFSSNRQYEGDLYFIRDKNATNFFKSGIKKIKGMNKPAQGIIQQVNS